MSFNRLQSSNMVVLTSYYLPRDETIAVIRTANEKARSRSAGKSVLLFLAN